MVDDEAVDGGLEVDDALVEAGIGATVILQGAAPTNTTAVILPISDLSLRREVRLAYRQVVPVEIGLGQNELTALLGHLDGDRPAGLAKRAPS